MRAINEHMKVAEVIRRWPATPEVFLDRGCPDMRGGFFGFMARLMSVKNAARMHGIPLEPLLDDLNRAAQAKPEDPAVMRTRRPAFPAERPPIVEKYGRLAAQYDATWPFYIEATTCETMRRLTLRTTDRLLDVGCGTGVLLQRLAVAYPHSRLVGIDLVPEMLAVARRRLPSNVELCEGWAERLPFDDRQFDLVVSCNTFHYFRRPRAALAEFRRVLRPGGRITITDWCDDYLACRLYDLYLRLFNRGHVKTYGGRDCIRVLEEAGFTVVRLDRYKINWWWGLMTAQAAKHGR